MKVIINGIECEANEGEYILNVARKNDIFIPAICYLNGCSPTLACRMCMVEADGKKVYSCNTKVKEGMVVRVICQIYGMSVMLSCKHIVSTTLYNVGYVINLANVSFKTLHTKQE